MAFNKFDLSEKTALITGAGGLLGVEHAAALLDSGCEVVLTDISESQLSQAHAVLKKEFPGGLIKAHQMDVSDLKSIEIVASLLEGQNTSVEILINNAAIDPKVTDKKSIIEASRLENFSREQWDLEISVGLTGAFLCSQTFGALMAQNGKGGVILNIASDLSVFAPDQRLYRTEGLIEERQAVKPITYSVIKAGLVGLTRYLATYWPDKGIRSNALSPGGVLSGQSDEFVLRLSQLIPMGRMANKDEYRAAVQFLCSDASAYMNGQNIVMDGGRSVW